MIRRFIIFTVLVGMTLSLGCSSSLSTRKRIKESLPAASRVAVLPFENLSGREKAAEKLTDYFVSTMAGYNRFEAVEFGQLYEHMRRFRIRSSSTLTDEQIDSLASGMGLDYIVTGATLEYEEFDNNFLGRVPQVSFNCKLIDCHSKKTIWVASSNGRGDKGEIAFGIGTVKSADKLARKMVEETVDELAGLFARQ